MFHENMIFLPSQPKIIKKEGKNKAMFEIESLYPGYGVTIGNSLRRVLLSSLPGAAATQVKIKGVQHEFSTIPGVSEDGITIMLNLKQLRFKIYTDEPQKATLKVKGEKEVKGGDFELPPQVELVNPDAHLATLTTKSAELEIEILIEKGLGYESRESRKKPSDYLQKKLEIGVIPLDSIFTPMKRVAFRVENMRVGERTDFDRLFLEIETDGTITPEDAFSQATEILLNHFNLLSQSFTRAAAKGKKEDLSSLTKAKKISGINFNKLAVIAGILQGLAVIPGLSRSGATIFGLSLGKLNPGEILKISYMMSAPAVLAMSGFLFIKNPTLISEGWPALVFSFLAGFLALGFLLKIAAKIDFFKFTLIFAFFCFLGAGLELLV